MVGDAKRELRSRLRAARRALDPARRAAESAVIAASCRELLARAEPSALASYLALPDEVDLGPLHAWWWGLGRLLWLPRVNGPGSLSWHPVGGLGQVRDGAHGIREPDPALVLAADLPPDATVLVPGVGYTAGGHRLGQGGGFYDRVLEGHRGPTIGVAFACQRVAAVPLDDHDRAVDRVIFGG